MGKKSFLENLGKIIMEIALQNKACLVTGGTGLVGSHVVERLLGLNAQVFVVDLQVLSKSYFDLKKFSDKCPVFIQDVRDAVKIKEIVDQNRIEYIFHLAAQPIVGEAFLHPMLTLDTNIMGTVSVLEAAKENKNIKAVVVASSDKAYGKHSYNVTEDQPLSGDHPYDVSKSAADLISMAYFHTYNLPVTVSRFGNIFGPGDLNFSRIVPGVMDSIINNKNLEIRSDGTFVRDYVYVKDVADGYVVLAEQIGKTAGQAFNFSSGHNLSVLKIIEDIEKVIGKKLKYRVVNSQQNEIPRQSLNYEKVRKTLDWKPKFTFEQGIKETFEWYKSFFKQA